MSTICTYLRPDIANMAGYTPGEQPRVANILKLVAVGHLKRILMSHDSIVCWLGRLRMNSHLVP